MRGLGQSRHDNTTKPSAFPTAALGILRSLPYDRRPVCRFTVITSSSSVDGRLQNTDALNFLLRWFIYAGMRLLHTQTLDLEPFFDSQTRPPYAVLSHTWEPEHPRHSEFATDAKKAASGPGSTFVRRACAAVQQLGYRYVWIECICVDSSSVAEVSEAINSAYRLFQEAAACLVYLADLRSGDVDEDAWQQCKWWTRAWTLPELLAPSTVRFYDRDWNFRGIKSSTPLLSLISRITAISEDVLCDGSLIPQVSIAKRMSWAASRKAWRVEDRAYSLLGVFGVHMQAIYGEGTASFLRLQDEILKHTRDMSLLAWEAHPEDDRPFRGLLASSPVEFSRFTSCPPKWTIPLAFEGEIQNNNKGLSITGSFFSYPINGQQVLLLDLGAKHSAPNTKAALVLFRHGDCFVRAASNAAVTLKGPATPVAMKVSAARDLTPRESKTVAESLRVPTFANGFLTFPSAPKVPGQPGLATNLPFRGQAGPAPLTARCRGGSIASSFDSYVFSRAGTSLAPMPPELGSTHKKRAFANALSDRDDKRARTKLATLPSGPGSNVSSLSDSDTNGGRDSDSEEDLSSFDEVRPEPLVLEEGHPFLAVADELIETAISEFETWRKTGPPPTGTRFFACPFRARNPTRYAECLKHAALRNPRDVKRHVWQEHRLPNYCPVCYSVFETESECSEHIVQRICKLKSRPDHLEGVSEDQKKLLARRDRSGASREQRWFAIWDIVFPREPPPRPFPHGGEDRAVADVREFWEGRGRKVVAGFLREKGLLSWDMKDEERALAAVHKLVGGRLIEGVFEEAWVFVNQVGCPQFSGRTLMSGLLPGAGVSMAGAPLLEVLPRDPGKTDSASVGVEADTRFLSPEGDRR